MSNNGDTLPNVAIANGNNDNNANNGNNGNNVNGNVNNANTTGGATTTLQAQLDAMQQLMAQQM